LNGNFKLGMSAVMPFDIAWPNVSLTYMNTAVFGATFAAVKTSPIIASPFLVSSGAGGKLRNTYL
jgi:hypothetical protein